MAKDLSGPNAGGHELGDIVAVGMRPSGGGRVALVEPPKPGEPTMRWISHAHSIDEIELELNRIWAQPDLLVGSDEERPFRHIAARTSVMNLVVVARQPEVGERTRRDDPAADRSPPVADAHRPVRGPGRPAVARGADPGALRAAPRGRARDVHGDDLPHRGRRDGTAPDRARGAAARPRPAGHRVVAGRAAAGPRARPRAARGHRPPRRGRARRGAATGCGASTSSPSCTTSSTGSRSATSRSSGSPAGARRSRPCSRSPSSCRSSRRSSGSR